MKNTVHNGNERIELVEVSQECLAEVTGGAMMAYRTSSVMDCAATGGAGAISAAIAYAPLDNSNKV
jgi:hypothetical protein